MLNLNYYKMTRDLENEFIGTGDIKGFKLVKLASTDKGFLYSVDSGEGNIHYEVFQRKTTPICLDFEKKIFSDTDSKVIYPKDEHFGQWASCILEYKDALEKLNSL